MPKKIDHHQAQAELAKVAPDTLRAFSVRLPAGLLIEVHRWAEGKGLDLTTAIRELATRGLEAANLSDASSSADPKEIKKWQRILEQALRKGLSPFEPFLDKDEPDVKPLAGILAKMNFETIYEQLKAARERDEPLVERKWNRIKETAQSHVRPLMKSLDELEKRFLARKQWYYGVGDDDEFACLRWLLSDDVMQALKQPSPADKDIEAVKKLIAARYLDASYPNEPWAFFWIE